MPTYPCHRSLLLVPAVFLIACAGASPSNPDGGKQGLDLRGLDTNVKKPDYGNYVPPNCGNAELTTDEACDDGNTESGDGCAANCLEVEPGFSCIPSGQPCHRIARCGDGVTVPPELCDDNNRTAGDGCSATCKIEVGWKCEGSPSVCSHTTCGDGKIEGAESCEDGNAAPWDGCSADCQIEPTCTTTGCSSKCGDGIVLGEDCDDGNNIDGDGCSADCKTEDGYACKQPPLDRMDVPVVYRDFKYNKPTDFEPSAKDQNVATTGLVADTLDGKGKPTYIGSYQFISGAASFNQWYNDTAGVNQSVTRKLTLWKNDAGFYENRWGPNGEYWQKTVSCWAGSVQDAKLDANGEKIPCTFKYGNSNCDTYVQQGLTQLRCDTATDSVGTYTATYLLQNVPGTPVFFPIDDVTFSTERTSASIAPPLYADNWGDEPGKPLHNFSFTSEIHYWFQYDSTKTYKLDFTGDDDVWFFINRKLAVDLGGIHIPASGSITVTAANAADFGLENGKVYEIAAFHAERQTTGSSFQLTLGGFNPSPSDCLPECGDGIIGLGEECDDGPTGNTGGYGKCGPECKLSEFCGDGIVQPDYEDCDTNPTPDGVACPMSCRILIIP